MSTLAFIVPGALNRPTGGSRYDRHMVEGLQAAGLEIDVHSLGGQFPTPDQRASQAIDECLTRLDDGQWVLVDGLVLGGSPKAFAAHAQRLHFIALVHHPLADETGLTPTRADALKDSEALALTLAQGVIVTSDFTRRRLDQLGLYQQAVHVVPPGVEPLALRPARNESMLHFLCLGSLIPRKGQDILIDSLNALKELPWQASLVGAYDLNPAFANACQAQINAHRLEQKIRLTGALDDDALKRIWATTDVLVLPSRYEGYGMVVTEAIARGIPVITTDAGALPDTLPPKAGICVAHNDAVALADALASVITQPDRLHELTQSAVSARTSLNSWSEQVSDFKNAIKAIQTHG